MNDSLERNLNTLASFYDLRHGIYAGDLPFYMMLLADTKGVVLELGCGTGRLLTAIAVAGHEVIGADVSGEMLKQAQRAISSTKSNNVPLLVRCDFRKLPFRGATLAMFALNTFCHLTTRAEQRTALDSVYDSLEGSGRVVIDVPNPHLEFGARAEGNCLLEAIHESDEGQIYEWSVVEADPAAQMLTIHSIYDTVEKNGLLKRKRVSFSLRLFYRYELEWLLEGTGFEVESLLGDYDYSEYTADSPRILVIARKR